MSVGGVEMDIALIVWIGGGGSSAGGLGEGDSSAADAGSLAGTEIDRTCSIKIGRNWRSGGMFSKCVGLTLSVGPCVWVWDEFVQRGALRFSRSLAICEIWCLAILVCISDVSLSPEISFCSSEISSRSK